jgi:asparagine synthase (glutamine-hydrolysing)
MSGILGIVNVDGKPVDRDLLGRMTDYLAYRGPDARGVWSDGNVGFGHTMLRTTFEAAHEHQPFSLDGEIWITADARVDGRSDLIRNLGRQECDIPDALTDVALILLAYKAWDMRCIEHLIGDYAFAIWDGRKKRLFCARDHFGVKPFFYARVGDSLVFSNTLDCLRLYPGISDKLNDVAIGDYLLFGVNHDPATTAFADLQRLPGAHLLTCADGRVRTSRYWSLPVDGHLRYRNARDYVDHFQERLRTAVVDRLRTDRVACEMSGGLDSTSIAATAKAILGQRGTAFDLHVHTVVYDTVIPDQERLFSALAAKSLGLPIHYLVADDYPPLKRATRTDLPEPEPFHVGPLAATTADFLRQMAAQSRVALTGWDGDALMCESPSFYLRSLFKRFEFRRLASDMVWYMRTKRALPPMGVRTWIKRRLGKYPVRSGYPSWIEPSFASRTEMRARWEEINAERPPAHPTRPRAMEQLSLPTWWLLLEGYDPGVTRVTLEARHPLIDLRLVNYVLAIPPVPWCSDKHILREAMANVLPEAILRRPKTGLAGDPVLAHVRTMGARGLEIRVPAAGLDRYVGGDPHARLSDATDPNALWLDLRPFCLGRWLDDQRSRSLAYEARGAAVKSFQVNVPVAEERQSV